MKEHFKKARKSDTEHLLSVRELAELLGKTYNAVRKAVQRRKFITIVRLDKQKALKRGLRWRTDRGSGRCSTRPFVSITDPAISSSVRQKYYELLSTAGTIKDLSSLSNLYTNYPNPQTLIASIISSLDAEIKHLSSFKRSLKAKQKLLKSAMTGASKR
jgi:hypothetical protein